MGFMKFPFNEKSVGQTYYFERRLKDNLRVSVKRVTNFRVYSLSNALFVFSKKFTITKTIRGVLSNQELFGKLLAVVFVPICFALDLAISLLGLSIGGVLILLIFTILLFIILYYIIYSLFKR